MAATIGCLKINLYIPGCQTLKEKRKVIKSINERIRTNYNVSIAEIGNNDLHQRALLGIACISNDRQIIDKMLSKIFRYLDTHSEVIITEKDLEIF